MSLQQHRKNLGGFAGLHWQLAESTVRQLLAFLDIRRTLCGITFIPCSSVPVAMMAFFPSSCCHRLMTSVKIRV